MKHKNDNNVTQHKIKASLEISMTKHTQDFIRTFSHEKDLSTLDLKFDNHSEEKEICID